MTTITKDMTVFEVLQIDEGTAPIFFGFGMHCLGCPSSRFESLADASRVHGINVDAMVEALNKYMSEKESAAE